MFSPSTDFQVANKAPQNQMNFAPSALPAVAALSAAVNAVNNKQGVIDLSKGQVYDIFTIPTSFTVTVASSNAGNASNNTYIFNDVILNPSLTDNGGGAGTITYTYGDGFAGRVYNALLSSAANARGIKITGFTVVATDAQGNQSSVGFNSLNMTLISANGQGGVIPIPFDLSEAIRNTQYQVGTLTVMKEFYLNTLTQIQFSILKGYTLAWTFFTDVSGFKGI